MKLLANIAISALAFAPICNAQVNATKTIGTLNLDVGVLRITQNYEVSNVGKQIDNILFDFQYQTKYSATETTILFPVPYSSEKIIRFRSDLISFKNAITDNPTLEYEVKIVEESRKRPGDYILIRWKPPATEDDNRCPNRSTVLIIADTDGPSFQSKNCAVSPAEAVKSIVQPLIDFIGASLQ